MAQYDDFDAFISATITIYSGCKSCARLLSLKDLLALIKTKLHSKSFYYRYKNASLSLY